MEIISKYNMGDKLKDSVSKFQGIVMCITQYSTGCIHYGLASTKTKEDGSRGDWEYLDQSQLMLVKSAAVVFDIPKGTTSGAFPNPPQG